MSVAGGSPAWRAVFRVQYRLLRALDPLIRPVYLLAGLGDTAELVVRGRRSGRHRSVLVGLLAVDGRWYVGHPNGQAQWTRNLDAAGSAAIVTRGRPPIPVRPHLLAPGAERDRAIDATFVQHPWPGSWIYRAAARHIRAAGRYYRLEAGAG